MHTRILLFTLALLLAACSTAPKVVELAPPERDLNAEAQDLISLSADTSHPRLLSGSNTEAVVWFEVEGHEPPGEEHRVALNFSFVIDHSGSMRGDQLDDAKRAILSTLEALHPDDVVSVVAFSSRVQTLLPQTRWGDADLSTLTAAINTLEPQGTTAMYEALYEGYSQVVSRLHPEQINRVILFSDGVPNDETHLNSVAQSARNSGVAISTMGLGPQYNEDLMTRIADVSGGNYHFIADSSQILDAFLAEKNSMERQLARNTSLRFNLGSGISLASAYGAQVQSNNGRQVVLFVGDLGVGEVREIALKLNVQAPEGSLPVELLDTFLTWEDVIHHTGMHEHWSYLEATTTEEQASVDAAMNQELIMKLSDLEAAAALEEAMRTYAAGKVQDAQKLLEDAAEHYRDINQLTPTPLDGVDVLGDAYNTPSNRSRGVGSLGARPDVYMDELSGKLESTQSGSDQGKLLIKSEKKKSRAAQSIQ